MPPAILDLYVEEATRARATLLERALNTFLVDQMDVGSCVSIGQRVDIEPQQGNWVAGVDMGMGSSATASAIMHGPRVEAEPPIRGSRFIDPSYVMTPADPSALLPRRVVVPEFEFQTGPTISLGEIRSRRFNLIDRMPGSIRIQHEEFTSNPIIAAVLRKKLPQHFPSKPSVEEPAAPAPRLTVWQRLLLPVLA
jgi:hypothetical protein